MKENKILIVEDESIIAFDLEACLVDFGYDVVGVTGFGEEAIKLADELKPDLVLMDIMLKGQMDGVTAAQRINNKSPVIFLTAYANSATIERAETTKPYGYLNKPFDDKVLYATVEQALNKRRQENMGK